MDDPWVQSRLQDQDEEPSLPAVGGRRPGPLWTSDASRAAERSAVDAAGTDAGSSPNDGDGRHGGRACHDRPGPQHDKACH